MGTLALSELAKISQKNPNTHPTAAFSTHALYFCPATQNRLPMLKILFIPIIFITFFSCSVNITENGQKLIVPMVDGNFKDTVLVVGLSGTVKIPDSTAAATQVVVKAPLQSYYGYSRMLAYAKASANKLGANAIVVNQYRPLIGSGSLRDAMYASAYKLSPDAYMALAAALNSVAKLALDSLKQICVVHIKDRDEQGHRLIFFNDTLVGQIKGVGFDGFRKPGLKDFTFRQNGTLKFQWTVYDSNMNLADSNSIHVTIGNEYYIVLYIPLSRKPMKPMYELVDHDRFLGKTD